jgi:hypothetical protein
MAKKRFSSHLAGNEITTHGYRVLTIAKGTIIVITEHAVTSGLGSSRDLLVLGMGEFCFGLACVESYDL